MADGTEFPTELEMQAADVPTPKSADELQQYIASLVDRPHDYGTCVYAMSMAAVASFNYVASKLGVTGFQASCADMDILRRTRGIERFVISDLGKALYPQSADLTDRLQAALDEAKPWLAEQARVKLAETKGDGFVHPDVRRHWEKLAAETAEAA